MQDASESEPEPSSSSNCGKLAACTVCGNSKAASSVLDLSGNSIMQRRLSRDWKLPKEIIARTLRAICVECVCKLNMHSEVTRKLMQRLQRLTVAGKVNALAAQPRCSPPIADAEVSTTGAALPQEELTAAGPTSAPGAISRNSSSSCSVVLQAYSSQPPESPTATESGGVHNNNNNNNNNNALDGWKWRTRLVCQYCERVYFRKDHYSMHVRRCWRQRTQRHANAEPSTTERVRAAIVVEPEPADPPRHSRTFQCKHCDKEFDGIVALRQHQRSTHQSKHRCSLCEAQLGTKYEWELHHTICSAKQEASATARATAAEPALGIILISFPLTSLQALKLQEEDAERTMRSRSRSRACSTVWYNEQDDIEDEEDEHEEQQNRQDEEEDDDEDDDDDDAASVADTMYTRRMNFTGDWIVNHSRSNSNSAINLTMLYDDYVLEESQITTDKEYDLYLLDVLKTQVQLETFFCFVPNCCFQTDTLVDLMKHDYMQHWKMSWFYCHKCGDVFTSKVFLDYHLHQQNRGVYICHKCNDEFEFQHQLDRHQVLHSRGINYHCNYCRLEFLSEAKLLAHCESQQHSPNDEPPLICIDHALSISNPVPTEPQPERRYSTRFLDIPHRPWPSNRPMHLPHHKPFRLAIGICEFDNRNPPNCVGCH
ncbi:hypothetical protein KR222_001163 [Zaprionus bogoriensis]|nr:hypothetical protein KR222_001163 [Zaprionus bogoriensis]